jgi:hypothetical protein
MRYLSFLLIVAVAAFVFAPGCQKPSSDSQAKKAEENRADAQIKNFEPLQDPTIRKALETDPAMAAKYKADLDATKLPGAEPVAPVAPESATSAASATPADSATPATTETPAEPAKN